MVSGWQLSETLFSRIDISELYTLEISWKTILLEINTLTAADAN